MVTEVPPAIGPAAGLIAEIDGTTIYLNRTLPVLAPPEVVTTTLAFPDVPAGDVQ
jgi:hypothetical protein